jgi:hypothetical protein
MVPESLAAWSGSVVPAPELRRATRAGAGRQSKATGSISSARRGSASVMYTAVFFRFACPSCSAMTGAVL